MKAFESLLRQEMAFFDRPENSSGAISTRLSSDAMAVQQMVGVRLGIIFETFAMLTVGLLIGFIFNWKLTSVIFAFVLLSLLLVSVDIRTQIQANKLKSGILAQSSSVRSLSSSNIVLKRRRNSS